MSSKRLASLAAILFALLLSGAGSGQVADGHDESWWRAVVANGFTPPPDASLPSLARELSAYLGSADPGLRDDIAYGVLTQWIYVQRIVPPALRQALIESWCANLRRGIGERGTDTVLLRSFSALMLSVAAALDNEHPYLDARDFHRLLDAALAYLRDERDTRGFEPGKGWIHSVAHTADLLKFLGRSRHLEPADQAAILSGIADKLGASDHVLAFGEDERLARAVLSILARPDLNRDAVAAFLESLKPATPGGEPTVAGLAVNQNRKHLAVSLYALLAIETQRELDSLAAAREQVKALLPAL